MAFVNVVVIAALWLASAGRAVAPEPESGPEPGPLFTPTNEIIDAVARMSSDPACLVSISLGVETDTYATAYRPELARGRAFVPGTQTNWTAPSVGVFWAVASPKSGGAEGERERERPMAMATFGHHGRELFASDAALALFRALCTDEGAAARLRGSGRDLLVVPVANPHARRMVERGLWCARKNPRLVDPNRNFPTGFHWPPANETERHRRFERQRHDHPGPAPFSEPESRIEALLMRRHRPEAYLAVHSGGSHEGFEAPVAEPGPLFADARRRCGAGRGFADGGVDVQEELAFNGVEIGGSSTKFAREEVGVPLVAALEAWTEATVGAEERERVLRDRDRVAASRREDELGEARRAFADDFVRFCRRMAAPWDAQERERALGRAVDAVLCFFEQ